MYVEMLWLREGGIQAVDAVCADGSRHRLRGFGAARFLVPAEVIRHEAKLIEPPVPCPSYFWLGVEGEADPVREKYTRELETFLWLHGQTF